MPTSNPLLDSYSAVILAGGLAVRMGGFDKAAVEVEGRTLLTHALDAVMDAAEVVVVGHQVPTERPVTFVREDPRYGGPVAGLLTGLDQFFRRPRTVAVLAVDMPRVTAWTLRRMRHAVGDRDGAVLVDDEGRRQLSMVLDVARLDAVAPELEERHGMAMRTLLEPLDLAEVPGMGDEAADIDTWTDLRDLGETEWPSGPHVT
ncbi:molybdenum cofactor guanylyltransferase [Nocardioides sp. R-C-SC26]|uniref:molybdenum cofactor guanylyltransferase n=1 Tax=Nocardioides sp. R-C-SC26 TaxID=2870414 RepID=UPI001E5224EE|nr:molybdenum cofactor guanylyltransferase [Nocardioides sp. R-C-SC26]